MKKIYMFLILLFVSGAIFSQVQATDGLVAAGKIYNEPGMLPSSGAKAIVDSLHYDGAHANNVGGVGATTAGAYIFFPASQCAAHNALGNTITKVKLYLYQSATYITAAQLKFYSNQSTVVFNQPFTPAEGWNEITLTTPFPIPTTDLYIGYEITITGGFPFGCDAGPVNTNGNWLYHSMLGWTHLTALNAAFTYNWNIRAMVDGTPLPNPIAGCSPLAWDAGQVEVSSSSVSETFTLTNTGAGTLTCSGITGLSAPFTTSLVPASVNLASGASTTFTFTYNPTAVGTHSQTAVIATNGGNISIDLTGAGVTCSTINSFPWVESFEDAHFAPACWKKESPDGGTGWQQFPTLAPTGGGSKVAYCTSLTGGSTYNSQWLISPKIAVQAGQELQFYLRWGGNKPDYVDVKVSTTTNDISSFTTTLLALDTSQFITNWKLFTAPLTAYDGQEIYLAIHEHVADNTVDGDIIGIDLVTVTAPLGPTAQCSPLSWAAGNVPLNTSVTSGTFSLSNTGVGTLTCSGITGLSDPFTTTLTPASVNLIAGDSTTFTFTYHPTIAASDNQTVVIATNGGNINISLSGNGSVGIEETEENATSIFPNPANDKLFISANHIRSVEIFNLMGETAGSYGNVTTINTADLSVGTYIVKVVTESGVITRKINIIR